MGPEGRPAVDEEEVGRFLSQCEGPVHRRVPTSHQEDPPAPVPIREGEKLLVRPYEEVPFYVVHGDDLDQPRRDDDWSL